MLDQTSACRSEHERLQLMFEHAPGFIVLLEGPEQRIALANRAFAELVGKRELIGKPLADALPVKRIAVHRVAHALLIAELTTAGGPTQLHDARGPQGDLKHPFSLQDALASLI